MASNGYILDIDTKFIQNLERADKALRQSVNAANDLTDRFTQMVNSTSNYSLGVQNVLNVLNKLKGVQIDPATGLLKMGTEARNTAEGIELLKTRTEDLKARWVSLSKEIGKKKKGPAAMQIVNEKDLTNINALQTAIANINDILSNASGNKKIGLKTQQQLVEQRKLYSDLLREAQLTDSQRLESEIKLTNGVITEANKRAEAVIKEKRREVAEAIKLANTANPKSPSQISNARSAIASARQGLDPSINAEQAQIQALDRALERLGERYKATQTQKEVFAEAKTARDLANTARGYDEIQRAIKAIEDVKTKINPDTKRGQAELQRLTRAYERMYERASKTASISENERYQLALMAMSKTQKAQEAAKAQEEKRLKDTEARITKNHADELARRDADEKANYQMALVTMAARQRAQENAEKLKADNLIAMEMRITQAVIDEENKRAQVQQAHQANANAKSSINSYVKGRNASTATESDYARMFDEQARKQAEEQYKQAMAMAQTARSATELRTAIAAIETAQRGFNNSTGDGAKRLATLENAHRKLTDALARETGELTSTQQKNIDNALSYAQNAQGVMQLTIAYAQLKAAAKGINPNTEEGKRALKDLEKAAEELKKKFGETGRNTDTLKSKLSNIGSQIKTAFGLNAIKNFVSKLVKIHGEFEKINVSLRVLIGSSAKAEMIWDNITKLALKSPFTIQQLAQATKQMAAYRIESNKLFQTTKMLADISAGLGVEMSRLILAYGQVKAANFLRGTELRQFSEAGIDMLGQLAAYFSEIEKKAISTAEVFDRISKRRVMFEDVDAVLQRVTSAGGAFYRMQEEQANTLAGKISNLKDAIQLMFHDIGTSTHGIMVKIVDGVKKIIESWRSWLPTLAACAAALLTLKTSSMLFTALRPLFVVFGATMHKLGVQTLFAAQAMRTLQAVTPFGWVQLAIGAVTSLIAGLWTYNNASEMASESTEELNKELSAIEKVFREKGDTIRTYGEAIITLTRTSNKLRDELEDLDEGSAEYVRTLNDINEVEAQRSSFVAEIAGKYHEWGVNIGAVIDKELELRELIAHGSMDSHYKEEVSGILAGATETADGEKSAVELYGNAFHDAIIAAADTGRHLEEATSSALMDEITRTQEVFDAKIGELQSEVDETQDSLNDLKTTSNETTSANVNGTSTNVNIGRGNYQSGSSVNSPSFSTSQAKSSSPTRVPNAEETKLMMALAATEAELQEYQNNSDDAKFLAVTTDLMNSYQTIVDYANQAVARWGELNQIDVSSLTDEQTEQLMDDFNDIIDNMQLDASSVAVLEKALSDAIGKVWIHEQEPLQPWQERFNNYVNAGAALLDLTVEQMAAIDSELGLITKSSTTDAQMIENLDAKIKEYEAIIQIASTYTDDMYGTTDTNGRTRYTREEVEEAKTGLKVAKHHRAFFPAKTGKGRGSDRDYIQDTIQAISNLHRSFKDLQKVVGDETAKTGAWAKYGKALEEALKGAGVNVESFKNKVGDLTSEESVVAAFDELIRVTKDQKKKAELELAKGEFVWEMRIELDAKAFDEAKLKAEQIIAGYELGVELEKLHIPRDFANRFFDLNLVELPELRFQVMAQYEGLEIGEEEQKEIEETLRKIDELETKAQQERLKKYIEFTRQSISERGKILLENAQEIADISLAFSLTDTLAKNDGLITEEQLAALREAKLTVADLVVMSDEGLNELGVSLRGLITPEDVARIKAYGQELAAQRDLAKSYAEEQSKIELAKLDFESFKESEIFSQVFNDLDNASDTLIQHALDKLNEFREAWAGLDLEESSEIFKLVDKLEGALSGDSARARYREGRQNIKSAMRGEGDYAIDFTAKNEDGSLVWDDDRAGASVTRKDYNAYREALEAELVVRQDLVDSITDTVAVRELEYTNAIDNYSAVATSEAELLAAQQELTALQSSETATEVQVAAAQQLVDLKTVEVRQNKEAYETNVKNAKQSLDSARDELKVAKQNRDQVARTVAVDEQRRESLLKSKEEMGKSLELANNLYDACKGLSDVLGGEDSMAGIFADMAMQMANTIINTIMLDIELKSATAGAMAFGTALNSAMGIIGWIVMAIQLLTMALTAAFKAHDKNLQKQIDDEVKKVNELKKAYEGLEKQLEKAFTATDMGDITREMNKNLEEQIEHTEKMIALEEDKKKSDESQIESWKEDVEDMRELMEENMEEAFNSLTNGILEDVLGASREFVDAWYDAFKETGDGMDGLKDSFKDMLLDMLKQQASLNVMGKYMDDYKEWLKYYIDPENGDDIFTKDEAAEYAARVKETFDNVNMELEGYLGAMDEIADQFETGELSGLQKGIQGITEDQAEVLASYWNSCRYLIANIDTTLTDVAANVLGGANNPNSIISELRKQTTILGEIRSQLASVIRSGGDSTHSGEYIKVFDM